jgi:hypothetical protein
MLYIFDDQYFNHLTPLTLRKDYYTGNQSEFQILNQSKSTARDEAAKCWFEGKKENS